MIIAWQQHLLVTIIYRAVPISCELNFFRVVANTWTMLMGHQQRLNPPAVCFFDWQSPLGQHHVIFPEPGYVHIVYHNGVGLYTSSGDILQKWILSINNPNLKLGGYRSEWTSKVSISSLKNYGVFLVQKMTCDCWTTPLILKKTSCFYFFTYILVCLVDIFTFIISVFSNFFNNRLSCISISSSPSSLQSHLHVSPFQWSQTHLHT